ncbi:MAG: outer membrane protein assembly factor BamB [Planctomycetota bacterium]|jgi:outer membrane protein assembly factor BamB
MKFLPTRGILGTALALCLAIAPARGSALLQENDLVTQEGDLATQEGDLVTQEGDLANDTFQPFHSDAELSFETGLALLASSRANPDQAELFRSFELMREAVPMTETGDGIRAAGSAPSAAESPMAARLVIGVEQRLWLMLDGLSSDERSAWTDRFTDLGRASLARGDLDECERSFPGTASALGAAIMLADAALEVGRSAEASTWCARAARHLDFLSTVSSGQTPLVQGAATALALRLAALPQPPPAPDLASFEALTQIPQPQAIPFEHLLPDEDPFLRGLTGVSKPKSSDRGPSVGIRAGMTSLGSDRLAIQTGSAVHLIDLAAGRRLAVFDPTSLVDDIFGRLGRPRAARKGGAPGWPHLPVAVPGARANRDALVLVTGRYDPRRGPNALVCVDIPPTVTGPALETIPMDLDQAQAATVQTRWILSGGRLYTGGQLTSHKLFDGLEDSEVQPGAVVVDDRLLVTMRTLDGEVRSWLLALDLATGMPVWKRLLAKGSDLASSGERFSTGTLPIGAAQPLVALGGRIFVGTHLGVGALLDAADGRLLWSFKNRRRSSDQPGWGGLKPIAIDGTLLWAPADSDFLYTLIAGPLANDSFLTRGPVAASPLPIGESTDLVQADARVLLSYSRAGANKTLSETDRTTGRRVDSIYLRRDESFVGAPLSTPNRVLAASNRGLFLFDRTADLQLLDFEVLPPRKDDPFAGGAVAKFGERLVVLGPGTLWVLKLP